MLRKLIWSLIGLAGLGVAVGGATKVYLPGVWTKLEQFVGTWGGWTEEARLANPVGYIEHVTARLERDLSELNRVRRELLVQIAELSQKLHEQEGLLAQAERLAHEFREKYQEAQTTGAFPITVRGAAYTADQAKAQVSLLLAEAEGYRTATSRLRKVREEAETQLEAVTVRINRTEAELVALGAQREVVKARRIFEEQTDLLAKVESLFEDNRRVLSGNPVRTVKELLAVGAEPSPTEIRRDVVEAFLAATDGDGAAMGSEPSAADGTAASPEETNTPPTPPTEPQIQPEEPAEATVAPAPALPEESGQTVPGEHDETGSTEDIAPVVPSELVPSYEPAPAESCDQEAIPGAAEQSPMTAPEARGGAEGCQDPVTVPEEGTQQTQPATEAEPDEQAETGQVARRERQERSERRHRPARKPPLDLSEERAPSAHGLEVLPAAVVVPPIPEKPHRPASSRKVIQAQF